MAPPRLQLEVPNPSGLCQCGCGLPAPIATKGERRRGYVRGQAKKLIQGHNMWKGDDVGYVALHLWVGRHKEKTGICSRCEGEAETQWANLSGEYRRDLNDFAEMCVSCHADFDRKMGRRYR